MGYYHAADRYGRRGITTVSSGMMRNGNAFRITSVTIPRIGERTGSIGGRDGNLAVPTVEPTRPTLSPIRTGLRADSEHRSYPLDSIPPSHHPDFPALLARSF